jgi:virginiamycin B lyase
MSIRCLKINFLVEPLILSVMIGVSALLCTHAVLSSEMNGMYLYGQGLRKLTFEGSDLTSKKNSLVRYIDVPLNITKIPEQQSNITDISSDKTPTRQEEFGTGFCGINATATGHSDFVSEYSLPLDCEMPLGIGVDSEENEIWYVSTKKGILGIYDFAKDEFEQHMIPKWDVRDQPHRFSQSWDLQIDDENDGDQSGDIWFTDSAQNAIWRFKKSSEQFEMYKIPGQSEAFGTIYPITIDIGTEAYDDDDEKSIFFIGTFFPSLWIAKINDLRNGTSDGIHEIALPTEYGFGSIDPLLVTPGSFVVDEDRNSVWISILSYSRKGQILEYSLDSESFNIFELPTDLNSPLGIVLGGLSNDDNDDQDDTSTELWLTNPGTSNFYSFEITEQNSGFMERIEKYTTSMASPRIFGRPFYESAVNKTKDDDIRSRYYTLPSWITTARDGSIWFNQQQGNRISEFDPSEQVLVEYWIPSQNNEWGNCKAGKDKMSHGVGQSLIGHSQDVENITNCGIANVLNFALMESDGEKEKDSAENSVEEVWFSEWSTNKIGRIDVSKDLPFDIEIQEDDKELSIRRGESERIKMTVTTNEREDLSKDENLIAMVSSGTFTSTGYLGNSTSYFDVPLISLDPIDDEEYEQEVSFVFTPSKDMIPGDYTLMLGAESMSVSILEAVKLHIL